ncbi:unnamed protein product [Symbiodinium microadriaticum]|nr:unnamed protein product [Symbiodinium microadriaticum]
MDYFRRSVECYANQTYPNKELVIVNDGSPKYQQQLREFASNFPDVRYVFLKTGYTLGALRNISVSLCHGDIWVQWDDDDFNCHERLMTQFQHLQHSGRQIAFLSDQLHYYFPTKQLFWENWLKHSGGFTRYALIPGTCMCWKSFKVKYPSAGCHAAAGEDSVMTNKVCEDDSRVSCVTVTTGRLELLKKSVQCYLNQTYPNKELIVLSQGNCDKIGQWIEGLNRNDIFFAEAPPDISLGEMRNTSIELAQGDVICQWDDDDLFHSNRVAEQYQKLMLSPCNSASCYTSFLKYFKQDKKMYWCDWRDEGEHRSFLCGAIMFHKKYYHAYGGYFYPEEGDQCHVEEDLNVLEKLFKQGNVEPLGGHSYVYVYHGENTYNLDHHLLTLDVSGQKIVKPKKELLRQRAILTGYMKDMGVTEQFDFCDLESDAFTYSG